MSHQREGIRDALATLLAGITGVVGVHNNRTRRLFPEELPAILIYTKSETAEIAIVAPREYLRTMKLAIEVVAKADDELDETLDDICEAIETRIFRNETLNGLVSDLKYSDTEIDFVPDGEQPVGAARLTFDCEYYTLAPDEQPNLDDWETSHIEMAPVVTGAAADAPATEDDVEHEQD